MKKLVCQLIFLFLVSYVSAQISTTSSKLNTLSTTSSVTGPYDLILFPGTNQYLGVGAGNPEYRLDINGRIRLRRGSDTSSGLWFNNYADNGAISFAGMENNDTYWGIWGNNAWRFGVNIRTGALKINGYEGNPGDLMTSNGANGTQWTSVAGILPSIYAEGGGAVSPRSTTGQPMVTLPMRNFLTITVYRKSRLLVSGQFVAEGPKCALGCADGAAYVYVDVSGVDRSKVPAALLISAGPNSIASATLSNYAVDVNPGTYTLSFKVFGHPYYGELNTVNVLQSSVVALPF